MQVCHSRNFPAADLPAAVRSAADGVDGAYLRAVLERVALPRHYIRERETNRAVREFILQELRDLGYRVKLQGHYANVVALPRSPVHLPVTLVGAHYDSVPGSPGADDNGSGIASLLGCARAVSVHADHAPVCFAAFNAEEDGFPGSRDFVHRHWPSLRLKLRQAHILEMVGYRRRDPGSQRLPEGLPIRLPRTGDFLGVVGNGRARPLMNRLLAQACALLPETPVLALKICLGLEMILPVLWRSDHLPFWPARLPALMWTDTADFRNPNYHRESDTLETLDLDFLRDTARLLVADVLDRPDWDKSAG